jgi:hypothetical protein
MVMPDVAKGNNMPRMSDISDAYSKEIEAVLAQSALLLQRNRPAAAQDGEAKTSGDLAERFVRRVIRQFVPRSRYVTSGYLVDPASFKSEDNLPQFDVIVADSNVPPVFTIIDDEIEIVPVEAAIAVFEVKRTLSKGCIDDANDKLHKAWEVFARNGRAKSQSTNTVVAGSLMPGTQSPILGVLGLAHDNIDMHELDFSIVDMAWAISGWAAVAGNQDGRIPPTVSREGHKNTLPLLVPGDQTMVMQRMIAILRSWLATSTGQWLKPERIWEYYIDQR